MIPGYLFGLTIDSSAFCYVCVWMGVSKLGTYLPMYLLRARVAIEKKTLRFLS